MKYIILICDGAADWSIESLDNKTIFESSKTPNMDWIATHGKMGLLRTIPEGMAPGSECGNMSIMGYDPKTDLTGRGPLEALSAGVSLKEKDIAFRCNLITISEGLIKDYNAGHISTREAKELIKVLQKELGGEGIDFFPGVQYRNILRLQGDIYSDQIYTTPPHDVLDEPYKNYLPQPKDPNDKIAVSTVRTLKRLIQQSNDLLKEHKVNRHRKKHGAPVATHIWPWSGGKKPKIKSFKEKYGLSGSVISAVDLIFGLGIAAGLKPIHVKGATGLPDTNYEGKINAAMEELKKRDFVYLHIEGIDEMAHTGNPKKKIDALEKFDKNIIKPIIEAEKNFNNNLVIAVLPDHYTPCKLRTHSREPVPFAIYNPRKYQDKERKFSEYNGKKGELGLIENGESFMKLFLNLDNNEIPT
ncbi:MAG: cofactor-independent phosphoglycerate mutase [Candidatus Lokiarchaeota archaeon]|nr:cofactor-independent phosphoglycerate mutase [Candidatus Lokiarchaeota archaeon]MBD3199237.1 cofactor-independent phosphoglycerate mutase [Candidatus Lokiarchaeota archaeon]